MASAGLNILTGIGAAAAGLAGEKVSKTGTIPGFDLAAIVPALIGKSSGGNNLLGTLASVATKTGLLNSENIGKITELACTLISAGKTSGAADTKAKSGIPGLAAAILGGSGSGADLATIAKMATKLGKTAEDENSLLGMATDLGKTLSGQFGVSFGGSKTAINALDKVMEDDPKTAILKSILKGIAK